MPQMVSIQKKLIHCLKCSAEDSLVVEANPFSIKDFRNGLVLHKVAKEENLVIRA